MTKKEATRILITHAARSVSGTGAGLRSSTQEYEKNQVREAIIKLWSDGKYGYGPTESYLFNLGLAGLNTI
jgi:hypothetical protein